jgi:murein L,D-transpeptidase YcbB/YkuD
MRRVSGLAIALLAGSALFAPSFAAEPQGPEALMTRDQAVAISIQKKLAEKFRDASDAHKGDHGALVEFYADQTRPVWVDENGLTERGRAVVAEIRRADDWGLKPADYDTPQDDAFAGDTSAVAGKLAKAELRISYAVLAYARDARGGRAVRLKSGYFDPTYTFVDPLEAIQAAATHQEPAKYLTELHPPHPQFHALRKKLIDLRAPEAPVEKEPEIVTIPDGPLLRTGVRHEQVKLLRARLDAPAEGDADAEVFDETLLAAVRAFQASKNIMQDGLVGPGTRRLLNGKAAGPAPKASRERQILINMERWRHVPREIGALNVQVNIPEFLVRVEEDGKIIHTERVVVGKGKTQTPIFSDEIDHLVFNPYWNVPNSIKTGEIRPYIRQEGGFFSGSSWNTRVIDRHNLKVKWRGKVVDPTTVPWDRVDIRQFHFYQPPGSNNVLGYVKFMFPNKHDVYLHDTNTKHLFNNEVRMESHGCVRVRNPDQLAHVILSRRGDWTMDRIKKTIGSSYDQHVRLSSPVPVHITYFTLSVGEDGALQTRPDVYGQDARLAAAIGF